MVEEYKGDLSNRLYTEAQNQIRNANDDNELNESLTNSVRSNV